MRVFGLLFSFLWRCVWWFRRWIRGGGHFLPAVIVFLPCCRYVPPGRKPGPGEQKLYIQIDGTNEVAVKRCKVCPVAACSASGPCIGMTRGVFFAGRVASCARGDNNVCWRGGIECSVWQVQSCVTRERLQRRSCTGPNVIVRMHAARASACEGVCRGAAANAARSPNTRGFATMQRFIQR